jgi:hypothetical protein
MGKRDKDPNPRKLVSRFSQNSASVARIRVLISLPHMPRSPISHFTEGRRGYAAIYPIGMQHPMLLVDAPN